MRDTRTNIYFSLKMELTQHSPQMVPNSTFLKKKWGGGGGIFPSYGTNFDILDDKLNLGTPREKMKRKKL